MNNTIEKNNQKTNTFGGFYLPKSKIQNRTPLEYQNDKKIYAEAERGCNGHYILTKETYDKLSEQTQRQLSEQTKFRYNNIVTISDLLLNIP